MIDGLNFTIPTEAITHSDVFEFRSYSNGLRANYNGLIITNNNKPISSVRGSIHKYFNNGTHNYDDFTLSNYIKSVEDIGKTFNIDPSATQFSRVEFGVNINIPINVSLFISYVLMYSNIVPTLTTYGVVFQLDAYDVKLYKKKLKVFNDKLRVEVAVKRKRHRNAFIKEYAPYCNTLEDLANSNVWRAFKNELIKVFDDILIVDKDSIDYSSLSAKEAELLTKGINPFYWNTFNNRATRANHLKRFLDIIKSKSIKDTKEIVKCAIQSKTNELINIENIPFYQSEMFTNTANMNIDRISEMFTNTDIDKGGNRKHSEPQQRVCKITSLSLDIGIKQNDVLSTKGVEYYYLNERDTYNKVLYPRLTEKMKSESLGKQFEAIAHSLRNERSNPRNNPKNNLRRDLKNLEKGFSMMFDFVDMLRDDKVEIYINELQKQSS